MFCQVLTALLYDLFTARQLKEELHWHLQNLGSVIKKQGISVLGTLGRIKPYMTVSTINVKQHKDANK